MKVDIYVREKSGKRQIRIPLLPEVINYKSGETAFVSYEIMSRGNVAVPSGTGLATVSWESEFPGAGRKKDAMLRGTWQAPKTYHGILEDWKKNGTVLNLMVTGYPINIDVYLQEYAAKASGPYGDMTYEITFIERRSLAVTNPNNSSSGKSTTRPTSKSDTYTIKIGDTLWGIARKFYGSGAKWNVIYEANKEIIEKTAKARWKAAGINRDSENGHWIFPGVKLKIPR